MWSMWRGKVLFDGHIYGGHIDSFGIAKKNLRLKLRMILLLTVRKSSTPLSWYCGVKVEVVRELENIVFVWFHSFGYLPRKVLESGFTTRRPRKFPAETKTSRLRLCPSAPSFICPSLPFYLILPITISVPFLRHFESKVLEKGGVSLNNKG